MCFVIINSIEEIADQDIVCYKAMYGEGINYMKSYDRKYQYDFNKFNKRIELKPHLYEYQPGKFEKYTRISEGYHSYSSIDIIYEYHKEEDNKIMIVECVIPKGTKYYFNEDHKCYVSENIIIKNKI